MRHCFLSQSPLDYIKISQWLLSPWFLRPLHFSSDSMTLRYSSVLNLRLRLKLRGTLFTEMVQRGRLTIQDCYIKVLFTRQLCERFELG